MKAFILCLVAISLLFSLLLIPHHKAESKDKTYPKWRVDTIDKKSDDVYIWRKY